MVYKKFVRKAFNLIGLDIRKAKRDLKSVWLESFEIKTVIDVGANIGQFAVDASELYPDAVIYSFEPLPGPYNQLLINTKSFSKFNPYNIALSDHKGTTKMYSNDFSQSSSILEMAESHKKAFPHSTNATPVKVKVQTLDAIFNGVELDTDILLKIDVQGSEKQVLDGGTETIKKVKVIIIETSYISLYKDQPLFEDVHDQLAKVGFRFHGNLGQLLHPTDGSILQGDSVFINHKMNKN
ncbi:MAG: FkbM family methyltransferase [Chloroflexota bacterium]|jgi:FkbM family methyltransferase